MGEDGLLAVVKQPRNAVGPAPGHPIAPGAGQAVVANGEKVAFDDHGPHRGLPRRRPDRDCKGSCSLHPRLAAEEVDVHLERA